MAAGWRVLEGRAAESEEARTTSSRVRKQVQSKRRLVLLLLSLLRAV